MDEEYEMEQELEKKYEDVVKLMKKALAKQFDVSEEQRSLIQALLRAQRHLKQELEILTEAFEIYALENIDNLQ